MKTLFLFLIIIFLSLISSMSYSQNEDSSASSEWTFSAETDLYFTDPFIFLPIIIADKSNLHLEARYNYEDLKTFSGWVGYNFFGENEFEFFITPMVGGVFGRTNGIAPGLEFTFSYIGFELYSESEYLFDFESEENNFFYNWTDLTYSPFYWLWFGMSGQITKLYNTDLETDRGLLLGGLYQNFEIGCYFYNPFEDEFFFMLSLSTEF